MADQDNILELLFPLYGIDVSSEFDLQRIQTTPVGLNVRGFEPATNRARGGSRAGLSQYVPATVDGAHVIQHLNYVVDPTGPGGVPGDGLLVNDPIVGIPYLDPSTNNNADGLGPRYLGQRFVPLGGEGIGQYRKKNHPVSGGGGGYTLQKQNGHSGWSGGVGPFTLNNCGNLNVTDVILICAVTLDGGGPATTLTISDSLGNTYTNEFGYTRVGGRSFSTWYTFSTTAGTANVSFLMNNGVATLSVRTESWVNGDGITIPSLTSPCS